MSPENSTRKVNTILKCQEINDIVLSSYGSVGEGDKCLALFTLYLPICDLLLCPSHCLCLYFSFILHLHLSSIFPPPSLGVFLFLFRWPWCRDAQDLSRRLHLNAAAICSDTTQEMGCDVCCVQLSANEKHWSIFIRWQWELKIRTLPFLKTRNSSLRTRPSLCIMLFSTLVEERDIARDNSYVFSASLVHILTPPMLLQHPGMGSKF